MKKKILCLASVFISLNTMAMENKKIEDKCKFFNMGENSYSFDQICENNGDLRLDKVYPTNVYSEKVGYLKFYNQIKLKNIQDIKYEKEIDLNKTINYIYILTKEGNLYKGVVGFNIKRNLNSFDNNEGVYIPIKNSEFKMKKVNNGIVVNDFIVDNNNLILLTGNDYIYKKGNEWVSSGKIEISDQSGNDEIFLSKQNNYYFITKENKVFKTTKDNFDKHHKSYFPTPLSCEQKEEIEKNIHPEVFGKNLLVNEKGDVFFNASETLINEAVFNGERVLNNNELIPITNIEPCDIETNIKEITELENEIIVQEMDNKGFVFDKKELRVKSKISGNLNN